ncbi:MAG: aldehyde dehydrogenase family protein [Anaerolineae bacterium]|nr:MAG: aldehyde dehydrogenase family protein [Anaerolineae bacterium]
MGTFQLTYATMFDPPEELHQRYEDALAQVRRRIGENHGMLINGEERFASHQFKSINPSDSGQVLGLFQTGDAQDAADAIAAAKAAFPAWSRTPWQERVALLRKVADRIDERLFEIAAVTSLEVGKNRMEALGDVAEAPALIRYACDEMERNNGFIVPMGQDPLVGYTARNTSVMRPYGVWLVISPFNFPSALTGGPAGAALVAGNTVVMKPAPDTPWTVRLLAECFLEAGLPAGVVNFVTGSDKGLAQALVDHPDVDGLTFTGSYEVGMKIYRQFAQGKYIRPVILELGGKNPVIVSRHADVERAAMGIVRSAFGLQGQKCSAASRIYIESPVYDDLVGRIVEMTRALTVGDPTRRDVYLGPVISRYAYRNFQQYSQELRDAGRVLTGGEVITKGEMARGFFCQPTVAADVPLEHHLWKDEMFLPITMVHRVEDLEEAMRLANDVDYGLTAGFYGTEEEAEWFFENIQAGVCYANRPQGASTGAWPGYQPFGGWKASGSTGKNAGGHYYLPLYMHEQSRTVIR